MAAVAAPLTGRPSRQGGGYAGGSVVSGPLDTDGDGGSSSRRDAMFGLGEAARLLQETIFGIVAVMSRGKQKKLAYAVSEALLVSALFLLFPLQLFTWPGAGQFLSSVRHALRTVFPLRSSYLTYPQFLGAFWTAAGLIALSISTALFVGYAFATQDFKVMFPLRFLRFAVAYCVALLYMPLISVLTKVFNCPLPGSSSVLQHIDFPDLECWSRPHVVLFTVACAMAGAFIAFATITQLLFFEPNFAAVGPEGERDLFSRPQSRVDTVFFLLNSSLSVLSNIDAVPKDVLAFLYLAGGVLMAYLLLNFYPYHRLAANMYQTAVTFAFSYASLLCLVERRLPRQEEGLTVAMAAGLVPAFVVGGAASWARFRLAMCTGRLADVAAMKRPLHVEIAARFVFEAAPGDEEAVEAADAIFRAGLERFPQSAALHIAHSMFCLSYGNNPDLGFERIRQAAKLRPGFDLRFVVYRKELERQQRAHAVDMGDARSDLIAHIEYKTNMTGARKAHRTALRAVRKFWALLAAESLDGSALEACLARLDRAERKADGHYKALLARYPRAPRVLRSYGRFQAEVMNDEAAAQAMFDQADDCENVAAVGPDPSHSGAPPAGLPSLVSPRAAALASPAPASPASWGRALAGAAASLLTRRRWVRVQAGDESPDASAHGAPQTPTRPAHSARPSAHFLAPARPSPRRGSVHLPRLASGAVATLAPLRTSPLPPALAALPPPPPLADGLAALAVPPDAGFSPGLEGSVEVRMLGGPADVASEDESRSSVKEAPALAKEGLEVPLRGPPLARAPAPPTPTKEGSEAVGGSDREEGTPSLQEDGERARRREARRWHRVKARVKGAGDAHAASIRRMKITVRAVLAIVAAVASANFAVVTVLISAFERAIVQVAQSGSRRRLSAAIALHSQWLALAGSREWDPQGTLEARAREGLAQSADEFERIHLGLFEDGARTPMDETPSVPVRSLADSDGARLEAALSLWDAGVQLVSNARRVARSPLAELAPGGAPRRELYFIRENAPMGLYETFLAATNLLDRAAYGDFVNVRVSLIVAFAVVTLLVAVLALAVFRPTVVRVQREKTAALRLFRDIPRQVVTELAGASNGGDWGDSGSESSGYESFEDLEDPGEAGAGREQRRRSSALGGANRRTSVQSLARGRRRQSQPGGSADEARRAEPTENGHQPRRASVPRLRPPPLTAPPSSFQLAWGRVCRHCRGAAARCHAPDRTTVMYAVAFGLVWIAFLVWFSLGMQSAAAYEAFGTERNFAGQLRSLSLRLEYHATEMASNGADFARQRALLEAAALRLEARRRSLLFGNASEHLFGSLNRYRPRDELLFGRNCFASAAACASGSPLYREGLHALLTRYIEEALLAARLSPSNATAQDSHIRFLAEVNVPGLQQGTHTLADLYEEEARLRLEHFKTIQFGCFTAVVCLIVLEYVFVFRKIIANLSDESRRTAFMFLMLPPEVIEATESIKMHLARLVAAIARAADA